MTANGRLPSAHGVAQRSCIFTRGDDTRVRVDVDVIELARGRKFEVRAEWTVPGEIKRDLLWFTDHDDAMRVARAAVDRFPVVREHGLSELSRRLGITPA